MLVYYLQSSSDIFHPLVLTHTQLHPFLTLYLFQVIVVRSIITSISNLQKNTSLSLVYISPTNPSPLPSSFAHLPLGVYPFCQPTYTDYTFKNLSPDRAYTHFDKPPYSLRFSTIISTT